MLPNSMDDSLLPTDHSATCLAGVFLGTNRPLELRRFPLSSLADGEARVRIECCTICGSDMHTITGARNEAVPSILGHEAVGVIDAVGPLPPWDVNGQLLRCGDRVTWSTSVSCGSCDRCQRGLPQKCRTLAKYGHELAEGRLALSGGLAEFLLLRRGSTVVRIAPDMPAEVICPANCATATIAAAFRTIGEIAGRSVLIFGAGMLGLTAAAMARARGASSIVVCDNNPQRLALAPRFGASDCVAWSASADQFDRRLARGTEVGAFDIVLELSGSPDAVEAAGRLAGIGARIVLIGTVMKSRSIQIEPESIVRRCLSIHGVHNYAPEDLKAAVDFLARFQSSYPFSELVERAYSLVDINVALQAAIDRRPVRIAIHP